MLSFLSGLSYVFQFATAVTNTQMGIFQVKIVLLVCQTRQYFSLWHTHWKRCWAGAVTLPIAVQCWTLSHHQRPFTDEIQSAQPAHVTYGNISGTFDLPQENLLPIPT